MYMHICTHPSPSLLLYLRLTFSYLSFFPFSSPLVLAPTYLCSMRIRKEYNKWVEWQKKYSYAYEPAEPIDCRCGTLVLVVDERNKTVRRDHFNHCPSKCTTTNIEAPDILMRSSNFRERVGENAALDANLVFTMSSSDEDDDDDRDVEHEEESVGSNSTVA